MQFARTGRLMLNDEPGTGKTASSVLAVAEVGADALPVVVVCPASVVTAWVEAWATWAPHLHVGRYMGPKRAALLATEPRPHDVLVTSYDTMARDVDKLNALFDGRGTVILDEHHLIKNPKAARSKAARKLAGHACGT
ncbi:SNF2-related protein, partial [Collinsella sp. Sow4_E3]|uniref:SNF2-related protein n=1 Tax=Collinsella sp. Sow4_E3 TaxID=3438776 RepID=UPI003F9148F4